MIYKLTKRTIFLSTTSLCLLLAAVLVSAQNIPIGAWRVHNSYNEAKNVAFVGNKVYCGTSGGLFYLDQEDNSIHTITQMDGLSAIAISDIAYSAAKDVLVIGYENGYIDLIRDKQISSFDQVFKSDLIGSKKINHISLIRNYALLSCDFGAVLFDLDKNQIKESYLNIGEQGAKLKINLSAIKGDSIYLATDKGIYRAKFGTSNLMDFKNWSKLKLPASIDNLEVKALLSHQNTWYFAIASKGIYSNKTNQWAIMDSVAAKNVYLCAHDKKILAVAGAVVVTYDEEKKDTLAVPSISYPSKFTFDSRGGIWLADWYYGLVRHDQNRSTSILPNGPNYNQAAMFLPFNNIMAAVSGGYKTYGEGIYAYKGYYLYENNNWTNYSPGRNTEWVSDMTSVSYFKARNSLYIGTASEGVLVVNQRTNERTFINSKTPGCPLSIAASSYPITRAFDTYVDDRRNNLWICNPLADFSNLPTIHVLKPTNECASFTFPSNASKFPYQLLVDDNDNKWVRLRIGQGALLVFNEKTMLSTTTPLFVELTEGKGNGNLPSANVLCMTKDLKGDIWVGTAKGVCVFYSPRSLGSVGASTFESSSPIYENRPLLFDQLVTAIAIDGGNRKWIGTSNGLYLFSEDGTQVIHYFTTKNSPILSNNIIAVRVDPNSGEVFISTDVNIVSFRDASSISKEQDLSQISIFPNPMSQSYEGFVGFKDVANNSIVKVIDVAGRLVFETKSNGGTASWNGRDYNGRKIAPGVYIVVASKEDGTSATEGKLFVTE